MIKHQNKLQIRYHVHARPKQIKRMCTTSNRCVGEWGGDLSALIFHVMKALMFCSNANCFV